MKLWKAAVLMGLVVLAACSSSTKPSKSSGSASNSYARPDRDGAPWWDVDVSKIPDAVPTPHYGPVKANPYTVMGQTYYPIPSATGYRVEGTASWYGTKFHGQATANGENYDLYGMSAAHKTLPLPCYVRVTNLDNGKTVILRVNDRGPFYSDRVIDLSFAAARKLGYAERGVARVRVEGIDPVQWWAAKGQPVPSPLASGTNSVSVVKATAQPVEVYTPPLEQHAAPVLPVQLASPSALQGTTVGSAGGFFIQVGAFANPDAAELLKDRLSNTVSAPVFISSVVQRDVILHRVRLGPVASVAEAEQLEQSVRLARLGEPRRVSSD